MEIVSGVSSALTARQAAQQLRAITNELATAHVAAAREVGAGMNNFGREAAIQIRESVEQCVHLSDRVRQDVRTLADQFEGLSTRVSREHVARIDVAMRLLREANHVAQNESALWRATAERLIDFFDRMFLLAMGIFGLLLILTLKFLESSLWQVVLAANELRLAIVGGSVNPFKLLLLIITITGVIYTFVTYHRRLVHVELRSQQGLVREQRLEQILESVAPPVGSITCYSGPRGQLDPVFQGIYVPQPDGSRPKWLLCNGAILPTIDFPELFAVIGNTYGVVDGAGGAQFRLPSMRGRSPFGINVIAELGGDVDLKSVRDVGLGVAAGERERVLTLQNLPRHNHTQTQALWVGGIGLKDSGSHGQVNFTGKGNTGFAGEEVPQAIATVPPYLGVHFIIRATS